MQTILLKHLVEKIAGQSAIPIVDLLESKRDVNEFLMAKKMNLTINQIRNILYKLSAEGLVSFIRKKDKRKGWYIYFWTLNTKKCLLKLEGELIKEIEGLKGALSNRENNRFYLCKTCNIEVTEEKALEQEFSCEECAGVYELSDSANIIKDLKNKILRKERDLASINHELANVREIENKKHVLRVKKEEKEKAEAKEKKRLQRQKDKKKLLKKSTPKKVKKTSSKKFFKKLKKSFKVLKKKK